MDIFEVLKQEHTQIRSKLESLIEATPSLDDPTQTRSENEDSVWRPLLNALVADIRRYHEVEESVVLSALREMPSYKELSENEEESDRYTTDLLGDLEVMTPKDSKWPQQLSLVKTQIEARIAEVESDVFNALKADDPSSVDDVSYDAIETPSEHVVAKRAEVLGRTYIEAQKKLTKLK